MLNAERLFWSQARRKEQQAHTSATALTNRRGGHHADASTGTSTGGGATTLPSRGPQQSACPHQSATMGGLGFALGEGLAEVQKIYIRNLELLPTKVNLTFNKADKDTLLAR
jgi:hypothetical protein